MYVESEISGLFHGWLASRLHPPLPLPSPLHSPLRLPRENHLAPDRWPPPPDSMNMDEGTLHHGHPHDPGLEDDEDGGEEGGAKVA